MLCSGSVGGGACGVGREDVIGSGPGHVAAGAMVGVVVRSDPIPPELLGNGGVDGWGADWSSQGMFVAGTRFSMIGPETSVISLFCSPLEPTPEGSGLITPSTRPGSLVMAGVLDPSPGDLSGSGLELLMLGLLSKSLGHRAARSSRDMADLLGVLPRYMLEGTLIWVDIPAARSNRDISAIIKEWCSMMRTDCWFVPTARLIWADLTSRTSLLSWRIPFSISFCLRSNRSNCSIKSSSGSICSSRHSPGAAASKI